MVIDIVIAHMQRRNYRKIDFQEAKSEVEWIFMDMKINLVFFVKPKRVNKKKWYHDEELENDGESVILTT